MDPAPVPAEPLGLVPEAAMNDDAPRETAKDGIFRTRQ